MWQLHVQAALQDITSGINDRLMLFVPPRHGKSELVTVRYPMYRLSLDPGMRVIIGAYNQQLANKFSRKARKVAQIAGIPISKSKSAVEEWETDLDGGLRAIGVGGGITGQGGHVIVIDDPVKSREEAESELQREKVFDWYTDDLFTRKEPGCAMILIMTRWHEDDLAGRILESDEGPRWRVISLPAEAEENDPLGRPLGAALCPERFDLKALEQIKSVLQLSYYALYQQRPQPKEGSLFKEDWFKISDTQNSNCWYVRYWDNAGTQDGGDWTCGVLMSLTRDGIFTIEDVVRGQWSPRLREEVKRRTAKADLVKYGRVEIWNEREPGSSGKESAEATIKNLAGFLVFAEPVTGDKVIRAEPYAAQLQGGQVFMRRAPWNAGFIQEHISFPNAKWDDQVDAASGAFNKLILKIRRPFASAVGGDRTGQLGSIDAIFKKAGLDTKMGMRF